MELIDVIEKDLKTVLSERRYIHSLGVMERAIELSKIYGEDVNKAKLVGIAHDIAKEMPKEEMLKYVKEHNIEIDDVEKNNVSLLHGKIGADIVKNKYGFTEDMQKAIINHTTTAPNMDKLSKILYLADKTEKGRNSEKYDIDYERQLANENLDKAILYIINENLKSIIEENKLIHPKAIFTRNELLKSKK